jgi:hypothetical protein
MIRGEARLHMHAAAMAPLQMHAADGAVVELGKEGLKGWARPCP